MSRYIIVETDAGLTVTETGADATPEETALRLGGVVVDAGPFPTYDDAYDALLALEDEDDELELD